MIGLLQRVTDAEVRVAGNTVGAIGGGLLVLVGVEKDDTDAVAERLLERIVTYRVFSDESGRMNLDLVERQGWPVAGSAVHAGGGDFERAATGLQYRGDALAGSAALRPPRVSRRPPANRDRGDRRIWRSYGGPPDERRPGHVLARGQELTATGIPGVPGLGGAAHPLDVLLDHLAYDSASTSIQFGENLMGIGFRELLIILAIALLIFGAKRLRTIGSDLGAAVKGFKKAVDGRRDRGVEQAAEGAVDARRGLRMTPASKSGNKSANS